LKLHSSQQIPDEWQKHECATIFNEVTSRKSKFVETRLWKRKKHEEVEHWLIVEYENEELSTVVPKTTTHKETQVQAFLNGNRRRSQQKRRQEELQSCGNHCASRDLFHNLKWHRKQKDFTIGSVFVVNTWEGTFATEDLKRWA